jgi:hypothetical protein
VIAATLPVGPIRPAIAVQLDGHTVLIDRRYRAPKGKVTLGYHRPGGGVGMTTIDDTDRLDVPF